MWTDWQGTSPQDAENFLKALQRAKKTGSIVEIVAAGIKTRKSEDGLKSADIAEMIEEIQYYLWKIAQGWDYTAQLNPRAFRNRHTIVSKC